MKPLYEIANDYLFLLNEIDDFSEGLENIELLDEINDEFKNKAISVASVIKSLEAQNESINNAIDGMKKRKDSNDSRIEWLNGYLIGQMMKKSPR